MPHGIDAASAKLTLKTKLVDLADDNDEKTRKALATIASSITRAAVLAEYDRRRAAGKSPKEALSEPINHPNNKLPIVRVRTLRDSPDTALRIEWANRHKPDKPHHKYLIHAGNAYLEIRKGDGKRIEPRTVRLRDAIKEKDRPAPLGIVRIFKGDTVQKDGARYVVKQIKSAGGGKLILIPITETVEVHQVEKSEIRKGKRIQDAGRRFGLLTVSGRGLSELSLVD